MDDAQLHLGFREDGRNRFREALETVDAGNEDIVDAAIFEFGYDLQPEFRALVFCHPQAKGLLFTFERNADGEIDGLVDDVAGIAGCDAQGVQVHDRIPVLPAAGRG